MSKNPPTLTIEETHALLDKLQPTQGTSKQWTRAVRNYTIALLMLEAGLRVGEVVELKLSDLYFNSEPVKSIFVSAEVAKNNKERRIPVSTRLYNALKEYRLRLTPLQLQFVPALAFCRPNSLNSISTRQVERFISGAARKSLGRPIHPHMLRHTFATKLMRLTNIRVVQELLGHKRLTSTQVYTHPNQEDLKSAIDGMNSDQVDQQKALDADSSRDRPLDSLDTVHTDRNVG